MVVYPVFLKLRERRVLLVGGGTVAAAKLEGLLAAGALVTVVAPDIGPALQRPGVTLHKRPFEPADPGRVTMYVCGPTVYNFAHIGNARPPVVFDTLFRLLRHVYGEDRLLNE